MLKGVFKNFSSSSSVHLEPEHRGHEAAAEAVMVSGNTCHVSRVRCYVSRVTCHVSRVTWVVTTFIAAATPQIKLRGGIRMKKGNNGNTDSDGPPQQLIGRYLDNLDMDIYNDDHCYRRGDRGSPLRCPEFWFREFPPQHEPAEGADSSGEARRGVGRIDGSYDPW